MPVLLRASQAICCILWILRRSPSSRTAPFSLQPASTLTVSLLHVPKMCDTAALAASRRERIEHVHGQGGTSVGHWTEAEALAKQFSNRQLGASTCAPCSVLSALRMIGQVSVLMGWCGVDLDFERASYVGS